MMNLSRKKKRSSEPETVTYTAKGFVDYYNSNIPKSFPQVTLKDLERFRVEHPTLFKDEPDSKKRWRAEKHRKRLMDWLTTHNNN